MTNEQLEVAILSDVVTRFANLKESTTRRALLIKFRGQPVSQALGDLLNQNILRRKDFYGASTATTEEEYLPTAAAFQFCGNTQLRDQVKLATTVVFHALQQMFVGEQRKEDLVFEDLKNHIAYAYPNRIFDNATLKIALYLAKDLGVLASYRLNPPDDNEVTSFRIGEGAITMVDPETEWDRVMAGFRLPVVGPTVDIGEGAARSQAQFNADKSQRDAAQTESKIIGHQGLLVFISHSSKDAELAQALIDLLKDALGLTANQIRCSSVDGYRLPVGVNTSRTTS